MNHLILTTLSHHLFVYRGAVNVGVIHRGDEALLIDVGDGSVVESLRQYDIPFVDGVLFTHHHRDQASGAFRVLECGGWTGPPEAERHLFEDVQDYWRDDKNRWHLYHFRPQMMLTEPVPVHRTFVDGDTLRWRPARITCLSTPGHTDGSMTYLVDVDGQRIAFCGDLLYDEGQIWELYSLQKGFGHLSDYHGFMSAWREVIASLRRIESAGAQVLVPSHGNIIREPKSAIDLLENNLKAVYENYLSTCALHYYFPDLMREQSSTAQPVAFAPTQPPPDFLHHVGTSWMVQSEDGHLLVMDCGGMEVVQQVEEWLRCGRIRGVDALWITHYHDDHVDAIPQFQERFACPVIAEESVAQVVSRPTAWRLPCLSPAEVKVDQVVKHGERWSWREFTLTAYHFPGQSLYHSALLVEGHGLRLFFCGDSLTPTGLDDYCAFNRNLLGEGVGYDFCLQLLEEIQPDMLFNCHVAEAFSPSPEVYRAWRSQLRARQQLLRPLLPWDNVNEGLDPSWVFCFPYEQSVSAGQQAQFEVVVTNHASFERAFRCTVNPPRDWGAQPVETAFLAASGRETRVPVRLSVPDTTLPGEWVLTVDVDVSERRLTGLAELIIHVV